MFVGDGYFALGLTSITGHTAEMCRDEYARFGFTIDDTALELPESGSVEAAFSDAGLGLGIADLRRARRETPGGAGHAPGPDRIRMQSAYVNAPVLDAFDGILNTPTSTVADGIHI